MTPLHRQGSWVQITKRKCCTAGAEGTTCAKPSKGGCCLLCGLGHGKLSLMSTCWLHLEGVTDSGEHHIKTKKMGDTSGASAHRGRVRIPTTHTDAGTDADG